MNYKTEIKEVLLEINTENNIFSPQHLDLGTKYMLEQVELKKGDKVLDLGCGAGVVGIYCAKIVGDENVVMSDVDPLAVELAKNNSILNQVGNIKTIESDGFNQIDDKDFTIILSNPPYHTDFSIAKHFIEKGFNRLLIGGVMYMVTKRKDWYKNKLIAIFGGVKITQIDDYFVFKAIKKSSSYANTKSIKHR